MLISFPFRLFIRWRRNVMIRPEKPYGSQESYEGGYVGGIGSCRAGPCRAGPGGRQERNRTVDRKVRGDIECARPHGIRGAVLGELRQPSGQRGRAAAATGQVAEAGHGGSFYCK